MHRLGLALAAALALGGAGCNRNSDCATIVAHLDSARDRIKGLDDAQNDTAQEIARAMLTRVGVQARTLEELERLRLTEPVLQQTVAKYLVVQREVVRLARERAGAMADIVKHGNAGVNGSKLEALCDGDKDTGACQAFFEALRAFPQDVDKETFEAAEHSRALANLEKIGFATDELKAASLAVISSLRRSIAYSVLNQQVHQGRKKAAALGREMRTFCRGR